MSKENKNLVSNPSIRRGLFVILYIFIGKFTSLVICFIGIFQFIYTLKYKEKNQNISEFSQGLSMFVKNISNFIMMQTDEKPWPLSAWKK